MRKASTFLATFAMLFGVVAATTVVASPAEAASSATTKRFKDVKKYTNKYRKSHHRKKASTQKCLTRYARAHGKSMAAKRTLVHQSQAKLRAIMKKCKLKRIGENIATGQKTGKQVTKAWYNSPGHRSNMLRASHKRIGVGAYKARDGRWYWIQLFGAPR